MALDTETERRSVLGMALTFLVVAPVPDGTIAAVDREHITGIYAGIAPGSAPTTLQTSNLHIFSQSVVEPQHISDSGDNALVAGDVEVQGIIYAAGASITGSDINVTTVSSTYTITATDDVVIGTGTFTITAPASATTGKTYFIKNKDTGTITLASTALIDGEASITIEEKVAYHIIFDGITWWVL